MQEKTVLVIGKNGKMGRLASEVINDNKHWRVVAAIGREDGLQQALHDQQPDVVLELSDAASVYENARVVIANSTPLVIGASGLSKDQRLVLSQRAKDGQVPVLEVPNFSIGAILMMRCAAQIAYHLPSVSIVERHHVKKKDSPSATAIESKRRIDKVLAKQMSHNAFPGVEIHSVRTPGVLAEQEVLCSQPGESLRILHQCIDRQAYAPGILLALEKVTAAPEWRVGLDDYIMDIESKPRQGQSQ